MAGLPRWMTGALCAEPKATLAAGTELSQASEAQHVLLRLTHCESPREVPALPYSLLSIRQVFATSVLQDLLCKQQKLAYRTPT